MKKLLDYSIDYDINDVILFIIPLYESYEVDTVGIVVKPFNSKKIQKEKEQWIKKRFTLHERRNFDYNKIQENESLFLLENGYINKIENWGEW